MRRYDTYRFWLALALICAGLTGCDSLAPGPADSGPAYWSKVLKTERSFKVRLQAALLLGRSGHPDALSALVDCAKTDQDHSVRRAAIDALAQLKRPRAIVELVSLAASDAHPTVAVGAKLALNSFDLVAHQEFVLAAFESDDVRVRAAVLRLLPLPLNDLALSVITKSFGDYPEVYEQAQTLLATMPRMRRMEWISEGLNSTDPQIRAGAVRALGRDGHRENVAVVIRIFEKDDEVLEVKDAAAQSLRKLKEHLVEGDFITDATEHPETHMRMRAIRVLEAIGGRKAIRALVLALADEKPPVRGRAAKALAELEVIAALPKLEEMVGKPLNEPIKQHLTQAAQRLRAAMVTEQ